MATGDGRDGPAGFAWRVLGPEDLSAIHALHLEATEAVGRADLIRPETRGFFEALLAGGGWLCGAEDATGLAAYGVLQWDLPPAENLRGMLGLPADAPFAKLAGAAVRPALWGRGLHEAMIARRVDEGARRGLRHLYATSAPGNARSWENLLSRGFSVRALVEQYGGHLRFILHRDLDRPAPPAIDGTWCDIDQVEAQQALARSGMAGIAWRRAGGRRELLWVPPW